jgi:hypothetical protein
VTKQLVTIELEGATYEEQIRNLRSLICRMSEAKSGRPMDWELLYISASDEGSIGQVRPPKSCALCSAPSHSGPCYYRDGVNP